MARQSPGRVSDRAELWLVGLALVVFKLLWDERDRRNRDRFDAQEQASSLLATEAQRWRDNANEWRGTLNDRDRDFVRKDTIKAALSAAAALAAVAGVALAVRVSIR